MRLTDPPVAFSILSAIFGDGLLIFPLRIRQTVGCGTPAIFAKAVTVNFFL